MLAVCGKMIQKSFQAPFVEGSDAFESCIASYIHKLVNNKNLQHPISGATLNFLRRMILKKFASMFLTAVLMVILIFPSATVFAMTFNGHDNANESFGEIMFYEDLLNQEEFAGYYQEHLNNQFGIEFMTNHNRSVELIHEILDSFPTNRLGNIMHPEFYGGSYIDGDGYLVIMVVESVVLNESSANSSGFAEFSNSFLNNDGIIIKKVDNSFRSLYEIFNYLNDFVFTQEGAEIMERLGVFGFGIDRRNNEFFVNITNYNEDYFEMFRQMVFDSDLINFRNDGFVFGSA